MDKDGRLDLLFVNRYSHSFGVFRNSAPGFVTPYDSYAAGTGPIGLDTGDYDHNGWLDVAVADFDGNTITILLNTGGVFSAAHIYGAQAQPNCPRTTDFNADGNLDFAVANNGVSTVSIYLGNGDGTFRDADTLTAGSQVGGTTIGDFDRDGDVDLICSDFNTNTRVFTNYGAGPVDPPIICNFGTTPGYIPADWDQDGDLDLVSTLYNVDSVVILRNIRPGVLHVPHDYPTIQAGINAAVDGDTVLVAPGTYAEHIHFLGRPVVLKSEFGPDSTVIIAQVQGLSVVTFDSGEDSTAVLDGFQITGARNVSYGGGIYGYSSSARIVRNVIIDNWANTGGGVYWQDGSPIIEQNKFLFNRGASTALHLWTPYRARVIGNLMYGGASFSGDQTGSAMYLYFCRDTCLLLNNTVVGNRSSGFVFSYSLYPGWVIANNILAFNEGWGVVKEGQVLLYSMSHNDVFANSAGNYFGLLPDGASISANPLFCDSAVQDFHLATNSPCVGTGEGGVDIGAFGVGCTAPAPEQPVVERIGIALPDDSMHVTSHSPALSWKYFDQQSRPHTKSEIEFGTNNDWGVAEMWQPPTIVGSDTSIQYAGLPLIDGTTYYVRVRVFNDTLWSNWLVAPFRMNSIPTAPAPLFPNNGSVVLTGRPSLVVMNAGDPEGDSRRYDFMVYSDSDLTQLAAFIGGKVEGFGQTGWMTDSLAAENQRHWWRARANDGYENGPWSPVWSFVVDAYNQPPSAVSLLLPGDAASVGDLTPIFHWSRALDPDPNPTATYTITLGLDPGFIFKGEVSGITDTTFEWLTPLNLETTYWWKVKADDGRGGTSTSSVWSFTTHPPCDCPCHGDPQCDSVANVQDVVQTVNVAFRGASPVFDPNCPRERTDVNCDGNSTVQDVVKVVNVAFRGANPVTEFCAPCGP